MLHAAAFELEGGVSLVPGWQSGGKTESLLAALLLGGKAIADEWTMINEKGRIRGVLGDVHLWDWQVQQSPRAWRSLPVGERLRLVALRGARAVLGALPASSRRGVARRAVNDAQEKVAAAAQTYVSAYSLADVESRDRTVDRIILPSVAETISSRHVAVTDVIDRIVASQEYERRSLWNLYLQHRYAFPARRSEWLERASQLEHSLLLTALGGIPGAEMHHPYPVQLRSLATTVAALQRGEVGQDEIEEELS
jgi:hypothetical protein